MLYPKNINSFNIYFKYCLTSAGRKYRDWNFNWIPLVYSVNCCKDGWVTCPEGTSISVYHIMNLLCKNMAHLLCSNVTFSSASVLLPLLTCLPRRIPLNRSIDFFVRLYWSDCSRKKQVFGILLARSLHLTNSY